ncbi:MAG: T9SS type A sorting domain-containing protein [FCB group bacterium]|jgi:hypothetical protein
MKLYIKIPVFVLILFFISYYNSSGQGTFTVSPTEFIINGDFHLGNIGFFSDYIYDPLNLSPEGNYTVTDNPKKIYSDLSPCHDHTTGNDSMLVANGSFFLNSVVWGQEVKKILSNTDYQFSVWLGMCHASHPSSIAMYINGTLLDTNIIMLPHDVCVWHNYQYYWSSGNNTSATITLIDTSVESFGNDFMIDDISFRPICTLQADAGPDVSICEGSTVTIGANPIKGVPPFRYLWIPSIGLNATDIQNPVFSGNQTTKYFLTVWDSIGCVSNDTMIVNVVPYPIGKITSNKPPAICPCDSVTLIAPPGSGYTYNWSTGETTQNIIIKLPGTYSVTITNLNLCSVSDSISVSIVNNYTNIKLDSVSASTGERVHIPIHIISPVDPNCSPGNFNGTLQYDQSLLVPSGNTPKGIVNGNIQTINFSGNALTPDIMTFEFIATLGDSECTEIQLTDFKWGCNMVKVDKESGYFCINNICTQPVPRLYDGSGLLSLAQNNPNPASGQTEIDLSLLDNYAELILVNILGVKVAELGKFEHSGEHKITFDVSDLSPGIYFYILQTPTQILTKRMEIMR